MFWINAWKRLCRLFNFFMVVKWFCLGTRVIEVGERFGSRLIIKKLHSTKQEYFMTLSS